MACAPSFLISSITYLRVASSWLDRISLSPASCTSTLSSIEATSLFDSGGGKNRFCRRRAEIIDEIPRDLHRGRVGADRNGIGDGALHVLGQRRDGLQPFRLELPDLGDRREADLDALSADDVLEHLRGIGVARGLLVQLLGDPEQVEQFFQVQAGRALAVYDRIGAEERTLESVESGDIGLGLAGAYRDPYSHSPDKGVRFRLDLASSHLIVHQSPPATQHAGRFAYRNTPLERRSVGELDPYPVGRFAPELIRDFHQAGLERAGGEDPDIGRRGRIRDRAREQQCYQSHFLFRRANRHPLRRAAPWLRRCPDTARKTGPARHSPPPSWAPRNTKCNSAPRAAGARRVSAPSRGVAGFP